MYLQRPGARSGGLWSCGSNSAPDCFLEPCKSIRNTFVNMKKRAFSLILVSTRCFFSVTRRGRDDNVHHKHTQRMSLAFHCPGLALGHPVRGKLVVRLLAGYRGGKADHGPQGTYGQRPVQPKGRRRQRKRGAKNTACPVPCGSGAGCRSILQTCDTAYLAWGRCHA